MREEINYDIPGVPVVRAVFTDLKGKPLWIEDPYPFAKMSAVGEFLVEKAVPYVVKRVAVCEGTMYANIERQKSLDESIAELEGRKRP